MRRSMLLIGCALVLSLGCRKVSPRTVKAIAQTERATVKGVGQAERTAAKSAVPRTMNVRERRVGKDAAGWAGDAMDAYDAYQTVSGSPQAIPDRPKFPHPLSTVQPATQQFFQVDAVAGIYATPNTYNGYIFYDNQGEAIGFSAFNRTRQTMDVFDRHGYLLRRE